MKLFCFLVTLIIINFADILKSEEIILINKFDEENYLSPATGYSYQIGDSIFFYANTFNEDTLNISTRVLCYYNNKFTEIGNFSMIKGQTDIGGWLSGFIKDKLNNSWFSLSNGALFRLSVKGELKSYNSILIANNIDMVNSILLDDNDNLWIQSRNRIIMFDGVNMELTVDNNENRYLIPGPNTLDNLFKIGNRIYFTSFNNTLSFYDLLEKKVDTVNYNTNLISYNQKIKNLQFVNSCFYFSYIKDDDLHLAKFDGDTLVNLDYYLDIFNNDEPIENNINFAVDKSSRIYLRHKTSQDITKSDTIYIIDKELNVEKLLFKHLVKNEIGFNKAHQISEDKVTLPISGIGLFQISKTTSIESPKNLIFLNKIYPNPARDKFSIDFGVEPVHLGNMKVEIYDYLGRAAGELNPEIIYDSSTGKGTMKCDAGNIPKGMYIVVLSNGKYTRTMTLFLTY